MKLLQGIVMLSAVALAACGGAPPKDVSMKRAAAEFPCPAEQLKTTEIAEGTYRVTGCGKVATYSCMGGNWGNPYDARCNKED